MKQLNGSRSDITDKSTDEEDSGYGLKMVRFQDVEVEARDEEQHLQLQKKTQIRSLSNEILSDAFGTIATQQQVNIDSERLHRAVKDAGYYAYGIAAVEVWILQEETGQLVRPGVRPALRAAGWWTNSNHIPISHDALSRLDEPTHPLYDDPLPCPPGCDLAGILYATTSSHTAQAQPSQVHLEFPLSSPAPSHSRKSSHFLNFQHKAKSAPVLVAPSSSDAIAEDASSIVSSPTPPPATTRTSYTPHSLCFRDIHLIAQDPDCAKSSRLDLLLEAGFSHAAGIHFNVAGIHGIVIYYTALGDKLNQPVDAQSEEGTRMLANEYYLQRATDIIGATVASIDARRAVTVIRRKMMKKTNLYSDDYALSFEEEVVEAHKQHSQELDLPSVVENCSSSNEKPKSCNIPKAIEKWWYKCQGAHMQVPPSSSWRQASFSGVGSLVSLSLLLSMNEFFQSSNFHISLGPLSSGIAAQYLLCSAPASQPRTSVLALFYSGFVSMIITYIPISQLPRVLVATVVSIFGMAKLGVPYPPAASLSMAIAASKGVTAWESFLLTVFTSILLLIPAIFINNMNKNRQYPIYWGYYHCTNKLCLSRRKKKAPS